MSKDAEIILALAVAFVIVAIGFASCQYILKKADAIEQHE